MGAGAWAAAGILFVASAAWAQGDGAPNAVADAVRRASPAVVKLYGGVLGRTHGYGTGVLVTADGDVVTAASLLTAGSRLRAVLADGSEHAARVVRSDEYRQLTLLKIDLDGLPHLSPASSESLEIGDTVIAVGNWFKIAEGDEPASVNRGVLSVRTGLSARRLAQPFEYAGPVLVFDAMTANPGAAGGPLLDVEGRFVGLVGRIVESEDTNTRINYALPAEEVAAFLGSVPATAHAAGSSGVAGADGRVKPDLGIKISRLGYRHVSAFVQRVRAGSPAEKAGVRADDLVLAVGARRVGDADEYDDAVRRLIPGQAVSLVLKRGNEIVTIEVVVGEAP